MNSTSTNGSKVNNKIRVSSLLSESLVNGPGVRLVVVFQGCNINCPECHNPDLHDENGGYLTTIDEILENVTPITTGITLSGGEPTQQASQAYQLLAAAKRRGLDTMLYTGKTIDQWEVFPSSKLLETVLDWLKVGPYEKDKVNLSLPYIGSTNQVVYKLVKGERIVC